MRCLGMLLLKNLSRFIQHADAGFTPDTKADSCLSGHKIKNKENKKRFLKRNQRRPLKRKKGFRKERGDISKKKRDHLSLIVMTEISLPNLHFIQESQTTAFTQTGPVDLTFDPRENWDLRKVFFKQKAQEIFRLFHQNTLRYDLTQSKVASVSHPEQQAMETYCILKLHDSWVVFSPSRAGFFFW